MPDPARMIIAGGDIEIDAEMVAKGLKMDVACLQGDMRNGQVTCRLEQGIEADAGRFRLTFFSGTCEFRLVADAEGAVLQSSVVNFGNYSGTGVAPAIPPLVRNMRT